MKNDIGALPSELERDFAANSGAGSGYQYSLSRESIWIAHCDFSTAAESSIADAVPSNPEPVTSISPVARKPYRPSPINCKNLASDIPRVV
jgi:hypothetical protein